MTMVPNFEIVLLQFEQPDESVWKDILEFSKAWNGSHLTKFNNDNSFELAVYFSDEGNREIEELEKLLKQKERDENWVWIKSIINDPTKEEIENSDFIQIIGDGYPDSFLINDTEAVSPMQPCMTCGTVHSHLVEQKKPLRVNHAYLDKKGDPNEQYSPRGLDIVNLPHGALLVSEKVTELIKSGEHRGCRFSDVIDENGNVSGKLFQLTAEKVILVPDNPGEEGVICSACGTVLSSLVRGFAVKKEHLEGLHFFSRMPSGVSAIYVSCALYRLLKTENIRGLSGVQGAILV